MGDPTGATGMADIDPPIWGANVINQYREGSINIYSNQLKGDD